MSGTLLTWCVTVAEESCGWTTSQQLTERRKAPSLSWPWPLTYFSEVTETSTRLPGTLTSASRFVAAFRRWYPIFPGCISSSMIYAIRTYNLSSSTVFCTYAGWQLQEGINKSGCPDVVTWLCASTCLSVHESVCPFSHLYISWTYFN